MLSSHRKLPSLSLLFLMLIYFFSGIHTRKYSDVPRVEDIPRIGNALLGGLTYLKNHNEAKTLDVAVGIMLVKGSLQWIENRVKEKTRVFSRISQLSQLCDAIFSDVYIAFRSSENQTERKFSALLRRVFDGIIAEDLKFGSLNKNVASNELPDFGNCLYITEYILKGTPNDSDSCIIEVLDKSCDVSPYCWFQETNQLENSGYKTSHRLLYLQLLLKLKCGEDERRIRRMKTSMCQSMLEEAIVLYGLNAFFARDLFLEQIALCGFEGFGEFSNRNWSTKIPSWRNSEGCFGPLRGEQLPEESCGWRSDINGTGCSVHLTAVAVSAMAFHMRVAFDQM